MRSALPFAPPALCAAPRLRPKARAWQLGPAKTLPVAKGDTITFTAYAWLTAAIAAKGDHANQTPAAVVLPAPVPSAAPLAAPGGTDGAPGSGSNLPRLGVSVGLPLNSSEVAGTQGGVVAEGLAFLRYRVLDENGNLITEGCQTANGATPASWQQLQVGLRLAQAGTVELSVETKGTLGPDAYFDDVAVAQTGGLIVQEQHQYAFGSPMPGLSYTIGSTRYRHGYQGQYAEQDAETGFDSFELRLYNSRIGRWTAPDPYGQFDSPYVGMGNNPVLGVDPDGGFFGPGPLSRTALDATKLAKLSEIVNTSYLSFGTILGDVFVYGSRAGLGTAGSLISSIVKSLYSGVKGAFSNKFRDAMIADNLANLGPFKQCQGCDQEVNSALRSAYNLRYQIATNPQFVAMDVGPLMGMVGGVGGVAKGAHLVYQGFDAAGEIRYVGITSRSAATRFAEHLSSIGSGKELLRYQVLEGATGLTKTQARVLEQTLINQYGTLKLGTGKLLNKINSISPKYWAKFGIR